jgi:hypothetical protein
MNRVDRAVEDNQHYRVILAAAVAAQPPSTQTHHVFSLKDSSAIRKTLSRNLGELRRRPATREPVRTDGL